MKLRVIGSAVRVGKRTQRQTNGRQLQAARECLRRVLKKHVLAIVGQCAKLKSGAQALVCDCQLLHLVAFRALEYAR
ncbi:MAG: hypothetical protein ACD_23C00450G0002 [uncultured bacterium]|nr:MAG: hypothetical protein ACD_23C00450G0002 [uncultured bacterium]